MLHNKKLNRFIKKIETDAREASSQDDIEHVASKIEDYAKTSELQYHHTKAFYFTVFCGVVAAMLWWSGDGIRGFNHAVYDEYYVFITWGVWGLLIVSLIVLAKSHASKRTRIKDASAILLLKSHLLHNNLEQGRVSGGDLWRRWRSRFMGFNRGDESRYIIGYYTGHYDLEEIHIDYELFRFQFVVVRQVQVTTYNAVTKQNETKTEERRDTYYRYGIITDFPYAKGMCISGEGYTYSEPWTTSSERFNKLFTVTADDRMTCAKVLQPSVVLDFIDSMGELAGMTLEINRNSALCLSCTTRLYPFYQEVTLSDTEDFLHALRNPETNQRLMRVLHGIRTMIKFNDKNFA
ncbi:MAG: hypothetical protein Q9M24_02725 [Mariprofundaceae bacterium]|nr:hypothetical protein [Mariprofundaceae bacterium]